MAGMTPSGGGGLPSQQQPAMQDPMMSSEGPVTQADIMDLKKQRGMQAGPIFQGQNQGARAQALRQMLTAQAGGGGGAGGAVSQNQRRRV